MFRGADDDGIENRRARQRIVWYKHTKPSGIDGRIEWLTG